MITLAQVQQYVADQILSDATLSLLGAPILADLFRGDEDHVKLIQDALETKGVCFEIGAPAFANPRVIGGQFTQLRVSLSVFVAEKISGAQTPRGLELVNKVLAAVVVNNEPGQQGVEPVSYDAAVHEHGYILHVLDFTLPVIAQ